MRIWLRGRGSCTVVLLSQVYPPATRRSAMRDVQTIRRCVHKCVSLTEIPRWKGEPAASKAPQIFKRTSAGADCCLFSVWSLFVLPLPLPSPLAVDWRVSGLLCGGSRENTHNGHLRSKRFGINQLRGLWLAKIFIALMLRLKDSGHKGYG